MKKILSLILIIIILSFSNYVFATNEIHQVDTYVPTQAKDDKNLNPLIKELSIKIGNLPSKTITLSQPDYKKLYLEGKLSDKDNKALQVSFHREISDFNSNMWQLIKSKGDQHFWRVAIKSTGASFIRAHLIIDTKEKADIFVYDQDGEMIEYMNTYNDPAITNNNSVWSPVVSGEVIFIEVIKSNDTNPPTIKIDKISHGFRNPINGTITDNNLLKADVLKESTCYLDVNCYTAWDVTKTGVARIYYEDAGKGYVCTGALLNDENQSGRSWFLTANHCLNTDVIAKTVVAYFHYRTDKCNGSVPSLINVPRVRSASHLISSDKTDFTLLELSTTPPSGVAYLGWTTSAIQTGSNVFGIHHPDGTYQRISFGNEFLSDTYMWSVKWFSSSTEGGSSGSPLFDSNKRIIGQLKGGDASCENMNGTDNYGKFSISWNLGLNQYLSRSINTKMPVYRFFNTKAGGHFFTISPTEKENVIANYPQFTYEGIGFYAYPQQNDGLLPVYRFFNTIAGGHFFTISPSEKEIVLANYPQFTYEGIGFYASPKISSGWAPVYRFFNTRAGGHFFTIYPSERDYVISNFPYFTNEGIGFYALGN